MGKGSAPEPPDYTAAAIATGEASREVTEQQTWANRPDQYTPWGNLTWGNYEEWDPVTQQYINKWQQYTTLDPTLQEALDSQMRLQRDRSQLGEGLYGRMAEGYSEDINWNAPQAWGQAPTYRDPGALRQQTLDLSNRPDMTMYRAQARDIQEGIGETPEAMRMRAEDAMYQKAASRLDPQWDSAIAQKEAQLAARGLRPGDAAYDNAMGQLQQQKTDAYNQAMWSAVDAGRSEAGQLYDQAMGQAGLFNAAQQQRFAQEIAADEAQKARRAASIGEHEMARRFYNEAERAMWEADRDRYGDRFASDLQSAQYQNTLRQAQIAEQMQKRGYT